MSLFGSTACRAKFPVGRQLQHFQRPLHVCYRHARAFYEARRTCYLAYQRSNTLVKVELQIVLLGVPMTDTLLRLKRLEQLRSQRLDGEYTSGSMIDASQGTKLLFIS